MGEGQGLIYPVSHTSATHGVLQEQEQLQALRNNLDSKPADNKSNNQSRKDEIEGGFGGQEELEDRYATTLGEH